MDNPLNILVFGAHGRFGSRITKYAKDKHRHKIIPVGRGGPTLKSVIKKSDVIIDVSKPKALLPHMPMIAEAKKPLILAITGQENEDIETIKSFGNQIPILFAPNFSKGISWIKKILSTVPKGEYEIIEKHHAKKKDAPSGTAKEFSTLLPNCKVESKREGDCLPEHTLIIRLPYEEIQIKHEAKDLDLYAKGALDAASFLYQKPPGVYNDFHDSN